MKKIILIMFLIFIPFVVAKEECFEHYHQHVGAFAHVKICSIFGHDAGNYYVEYWCRKGGNRLWLDADVDDCNEEGCRGIEPQERRHARVYLEGKTEYRAVCWDFDKAGRHEAWAAQDFIWQDLSYPWCGNDKCDYGEDVNNCYEDCYTEPEPEPEPEPDSEFPPEPSRDTYSDSGFKLYDWIKNIYDGLVTILMDILSELSTMSLMRSPDYHSNSVEGGETY